MKLISTATTVDSKESNFRLGATQQSEGFLWHARETGFSYVAEERETFVKRSATGSVRDRPGRARVVAPEDTAVPVPPSEVLSMLAESERGATVW